MSKSKPNANIYTEGGAVQAGSGLYIPRRADAELLALCRNQMFAYVLSPRQIGKSSLMIRTFEQLKLEGIRSVIIDLNLVGTQLTAEQWYLGLLTEIDAQLELDTDLVAWWKTHAYLGRTQRLKLFFKEVLLKDVKDPVVIFVDEIDTTLRLSFTDDFFTVIKSLYNLRSSTPEFKRLSFVLIGVATPDDLIKDPQGTPFSIGRRVDLTDFNYREASSLAKGLGLSAHDASHVIKWIIAWTGGHPYLTQKLCRAVADLVSKGRVTWFDSQIERLVAKVFFGEMWKQDVHFQRMHEMLTKRSEKQIDLDIDAVLATYRDVYLRKRPVVDDELSPIKSHLKLSGIVHRDSNTLRVRNPIYSKVFGLRWIRENLATGPQVSVPQLKAVRTRPAQPTNGDRQARIFISYKRDADPDEPIAEKVYRAFKRNHQVFYDQLLTVGTDWGKRIETELRQSDFLITLLSARSIHSEMVQGEIEKAYHFAKKRSGRPTILPVRLAYRKPFHYPLSAYLDRISWAYWNEPKDTPGLIKELRRAVSSGDLSISGAQSKADLIESGKPAALPQPFPSAQPAPLEIVGGTIDPQSAFYVKRDADKIALERIKQKGVTVTIKGPRQMGKSSLLMRAIEAATAEGKRCVFLDFQLIDKATLTKANSFFRHFCTWLTDELGLKDRVREYWKLEISNSLRCTKYVGQYLLKELGRPLALAMDEVDSVFDTDYRSDFFGMLRSWHDLRSRNRIWKALDLLLVTSTEPYLLIDNLKQSPFNVGEVLELKDFTEREVLDLNRRHNPAKPPLSPKEIQQLIQLVNGHPYLVRRALYLVASKSLTPSRLFATATAEDGPFNDHLRYHLFRLQGKVELIEGLREVIRHHRCKNPEIFFRLKGAGLVRKEGRSIVPRCELYAKYFREHLNG
jgi:hypothetical protein